MFGSTAIQPKINIEKLNHSNLTDLLYEFCLSKKLVWETLKVEETTKSPVDGLATIFYFSYDQDSTFQKSTHGEDIENIADVPSPKKRVIVFSMSKDQVNMRCHELAFVPFFNDVITSFYKKFPSETATLLLPIHQCGMYVGLDRIPGMDYLSGTVRDSMFVRDHNVLAEVNPITKKITVHDSQHELHGFLYWRDISAPSFETTYIPHKRQIGNVLCGYYVHNYIHAFLRTGNADTLNSILLDPAVIQNKSHYLSDWESIIENVGISSKVLGEEIKTESKALISKPLIEEEWELIPNNVVYATEQRKLLK